MIYETLIKFLIECREEKTKFFEERRDEIADAIESFKSLCEEFESAKSNKNEEVNKDDQDSGPDKAETLKSLTVFIDKLITDLSTANDIFFDSKNERINNFVESMKQKQKCIENLASNELTPEKVVEMIKSELESFVTKFRFNDAMDYLLSIHQKYGNIIAELTIKQYEAEKILRNYVDVSKMENQLENINEKLSKSDEVTKRLTSLESVSGKLSELIDQIKINIQKPAVENKAISRPASTPNTPAETRPKSPGMFNN